MDQIKNIIGTEIKKIRKSKKISQEKLAEMSELHPTYIGQIERGEKNVSVDVLIRILSSMDVKLSDFFSTIDVINQTTQTNKADYAMQLLQMESKQLNALLKIAEIISGIESCQNSKS